MSHATTTTSKTGPTTTTVPTPTSTRPSDAYDKTYNNTTKTNDKKQADKHKEELRQREHYEDRITDLETEVRNLQTRLGQQPPQSSQVQWLHDRIQMEVMT